MKNLKNTLFVLVVVGLIFWIMAVPKKVSDSKDANISKPTVSLSTFALWDITKHIAGKSINVVMILPFGSEVHSFEPTPKLMAKILKSDLVVYSGAGLEPWCERFDFGGRVVNMSKYVTLKKLHNHHHKGLHTSYDPHYWLDIQNMIKATKVITKELVKISPKNKDLYIKNEQNYIDMLKKLDNEYKKTLSSCQKHTIIVNHNAFSYMAANYGFGVKSINGLSADAQPNAKNMIELIKELKEHNISTVFYESFASDKVARTIAKETNATVDTLQPLANITADEAKKQLSFEDLMRINLKKLSKALKCQ